MVVDIAAIDTLELDPPNLDQIRPIISLKTEFHGILLSERVQLEPDI